ncbi:MAG: hypothetical protein HW390_3618 [Candidatus Brocadiaceae bacterium]|nr:hypothetical protein [Candidatus Brocadiaceae bacterium]
MKNTEYNRPYMVFGDDPYHPDSILSGQTPSDEHLIAMGKVTVAFTQLEETVSIYFSLLLGCEPELASILANSLPTRERCDILFHIFAYRFGAADMIRSGTNVKRDRRLQHLSQLFKKIHEAATLRNQILHSAWSSDIEDEQKAHRIKWGKKQAQPGFPSADYDVLTAKELLKHADFIKQVRNELYSFFRKHFDSWIQQRAENSEGGLQLL